MVRMCFRPFQAMRGASLLFFSPYHGRNLSVVGTRYKRAKGRSFFLSETFPMAKPTIRKRRDDAYQRAYDDALSYWRDKPSRKSRRRSDNISRCA